VTAFAAVSRSLPDRIRPLGDRDDFGDNRTFIGGKWVAKLLKRLKSFQSFENSKIFKFVSNGMEIAVPASSHRARAIR
jgi:hypothetical protein